MYLLLQPLHFRWNSRDCIYTRKKKNVSLQRTGRTCAGAIWRLLFETWLVPLSLQQYPIAVIRDTQCICCGCRCARLPCRLVVSRKHVHEPGAHTVGASPQSLGVKNVLYVCRAHGVKSRALKCHVVEHRIYQVALGDVTSASLALCECARAKLAQREARLHAPRRALRISRQRQKDCKGHAPCQLSAQTHLVSVSNWIEHAKRVGTEHRQRSKGSRRTREFSEH